MNDYLTTKVDFYRDFNGENYETFFTNEVEPACQIISGGENASALQSKVRNVRTTISGIELDWQDSVDGQFREYITSCVNYLSSVEESIGSQFIGIAEPAYTTLSQLIQSLKTQNESYQTEFDKKPKSSEDRFQVPAQYENGILISSGYFNQTLFDSETEKWKERVKELAGTCIETIASIEENKTKLSNVNSSTVSMLDSSSPLSIGAPVFNFEYTPSLTTSTMEGNVKEQITKNGRKYVKKQLWGRDYYVLADISSTRTQGPDQCLSYANWYAKAISEHNGYDVSNNGRGGNPRLYSSTDPNEIYQIAANEFANGRSVTLEVTGTNGGSNRHFVALAGFAADTDFDNIKATDVLILDPTSTKTVGYKQLSTSNGGQRRDLKSAAKMSNNSFGTDYAVNVYSNIDYTNMFPNTRLAKNSHDGAVQNGASSGAIKFASV